MGPRPLPAGYLIPPADLLPPPVSNPPQNSAALTALSAGTRTLTVNPPEAFGDRIARAVSGRLCASSLVKTPTARLAQDSFGNTRISPQPRRVAARRAFAMSSS